MTMHTYRYFMRPSGHKGEEKNSENDHPYSKYWETMSGKGMRQQWSDEKGFAAYVCEACGLPMSLAQK